MSEQQSLTRLVVLMFSLAARLFELHSLRGFMRNRRSSGSESKTSIRQGGEGGGRETRGEDREETREVNVQRSRRHCAKDGERTKT